MFLEQAIAIVGLVIGLHVSPIWLPKMKPFGCGFCTSFWISVFWFGYRYYGAWWDVATGAGLTIFVAGTVVTFMPWLFRSTEAAVLPASLVEQDNLPAHSD